MSKCETCNSDLNETGLPYDDGVLCGECSTMNHGEELDGQELDDSEDYQNNTKLTS